jgi:hypothetical protein
MLVSVLTRVFVERGELIDILLMSIGEGVIKLGQNNATIMNTVKAVSLILVLLNLMKIVFHCIYGRLCLGIVSSFN